MLTFSEHPGRFALEFRWHRDLNGPKTPGFHPVNGHRSEVYVTDEELKAISSYSGEVLLMVDTLAADTQGIIIHRILGIRPL
ncbi:MAG: hypothetical protein M3R13_01210 [Armatimonadota bacterium]|nr:hypothetical protein [Armatimonadota bacterium]